MTRKTNNFGKINVNAKFLGDWPHFMSSRSLNIFTSIFAIEFSLTVLIHSKWPKMIFSSLSRRAAQLFSMGLIWFRTELTLSLHLVLSPQERVFGSTWYSKFAFNCSLDFRVRFISFFDNCRVSCSDVILPHKYAYKLRTKSGIWIRAHPKRWHKVEVM